MTDFACADSTVAVPGATASAEAIVTAVLLGDTATRAAVEEALSTHDRLTVEAPDPAAGIDTDAVDCVVTDGEAGAELVTRVRDGDAAVPVILYTDAPLEPLLDGLVDPGWVDVVRPGPGSDPLDLLAHRVCAVVDHRRATDLSHLATAAAEAATDGIAVVGDDGTVRYANSQFARQFGHDADDLVDRSWRELFAEETVDRLESDAIAAAEDGWQWIGTCEGRRADGESVTLRTRVTDAAEGTLVFAVFQGSADTDTSGE